MRLRAHRTVAVLAIAAVSALGLAACSATSSPHRSASAPAGADDAGDGGQSRQDACVLLAETISEAGQAFDSASSEDPAAIVDSLRGAASGLDDIAGQITNDAVAALIPDLQQMYTRMADVMQQMGDGEADPDADLEGLTTELQGTITRYQDLCG